MTMAEHRCIPTPEAYQAACDAIEKHRQRADDAEAAIEQVRRFADYCARVSAAKPRSHMTCQTIAERLLSAIDRRPR